MAYENFGTPVVECDFLEARCDSQPTLSKHWWQKLKEVCRSV